MKVLFLDLDGVLNSTRWAGSRPVRGFIPPSTAREAIEEDRLDPACVARLQRIVVMSGASIVLSSSWRHRMPVGELVELFRRLGFPAAPVVGLTPSLPGPRGREVRAWMQGCAEPVTSYVCLDDDADYEPGQCLIQVDAEVGLQDEDVRLCVEAFSTSKCSS